MDYTYSPWNFPGQNTGVGSLFLLQGIFPTQGSNPGLQHCRWILNQLSYKGSPRTLECVARGSSRPRNRSGVSWIAGKFFTNCAMREAQSKRTEEIILDTNFCCLVAKLCPTFCDPVECSPTRILCPWGFPGKNAGEGCHFLLQGTLLTQGSNSHLLAHTPLAVYSLPLSHLRSPRNKLGGYKVLLYVKSDIWN